MHYPVAGRYRSPWNGTYIKSRKYMQIKNKNRKRSETEGHETKPVPISGKRIENL